MWSKLTRQTFIVTELVLGKNLFHAVSSRIVPFQEPEVAHIAAQVSNALAFCHRQRIAHRDIKLENVLVASINVDLVPDQAGAWQTCELYDVKLCDFGLAKILQGTNTTRTAVGTSAYLAPEIKADAECQYDAMKADTYSFGVMAFVMLCLGFPGKEGTQCAYWNHKNWQGLSSQAKSFASSILEPNPLGRLSMTQALGHQWLAEAQDKLDDNLKHYDVEGDSEGDTYPGTGATCNTILVDSTGPDTGSTTDANRSSRREVCLDKSLARDSSSSPTVRRKVNLPRKLSLVDENCPKEYSTASTDKHVSCSVESRPVNENCAKALACSGTKVDSRCEVVTVGELAGVDEVLATSSASSSSQCGCRQGLKLILQNLVDRL
jgi:serine/threonine protein kinase